MLNTPTRTAPRGRFLAAAGASALLLALAGPSAADATGGIAQTSEQQSQTGAKTVPGTKAKLTRRGKAIPPEEAPRKVKQVIRAANKIRNKPYKWGGGHGSWEDSGYDCSGAVSYALHGGGLIKRPRDSSGLARWGKRGKGKWITVFGARSHAYMTVAGLRFDTSGTGGKGPRWHKTLRSVPENYKARHKGRL